MLPRPREFVTELQCARRYAPHRCHITLVRKHAERLHRARGRFCTYATSSKGTFADALNSFRLSQLDKDIALIAVPTLATLAADPIASLVDTAYIGHLGASQLAAVGIALSIYATATKLLNVSLLAVTTSNVATVMGDSRGSRAALGQAASSALLLAFLIGGFEAVTLSTLGQWALSLWGAPEGSSVWNYGLEYLQVRAVGSPATAALLVSQGIFRGLGDTKNTTEGHNRLQCDKPGAGPAVYFVLGWGVRGSRRCHRLCRVFSGSVPDLHLGSGVSHAAAYVHCHQPIIGIPKTYR
eukprot:jgi/Botrbrau1/10198/Bobra.116_1s0014.1